MLLRTPLNALHRELGARMVDFGGWDMPLHYGSQMDEHHVVRRGAGLFDVSHMLAVDLRGAPVRAFLRQLLANDVAKLKTPGKALYSCMLNHAGGVLDDLIVYHLDEQHFRIVVNAGTREKDLAWMRGQAAGLDLQIQERTDLAIIALQGPQARTALFGLLDSGDAAQAEALGRFQAAQVGELFIARTGYTGEDGFEIMLPATEVESWWRRLLSAGALPAGLGARDTLRLEAGMNLYGQDMDEQTTPLESGLAWTVAMNEREFIGRDALQQQLDEGIPRLLVGVVLDERGVLRHGQRVLCASGEGEITSGSFAPTLGKSVALARLPAGHGDSLKVDMRGREMALRLFGPPFVRNGQPLPGA
ncbi:MAG: glycine cleavage system aminomethyltransferase GcvT [Xanthomonadales bacterium]|nr:glycine cleavage system aminomethyltransferase GcvT [Xanthomonadales bacterium]MCB1634272.1 glycine cleavage system aminomethyltransferase GcvT [Xanthomonadales bacterium]MCB1641020.1 glycine cleavage system aminomethyltransferase GcvT [Xanthomonadales bacterium]